MEDVQSDIKTKKAQKHNYDGTLKHHPIALGIGSLCFVITQAIPTCMYSVVM